VPSFFEGVRRDMAQDDFRESMMADFLDESGQLLDRLNENLLQLDQWVAALSDEDDHQCDSALLNEMFRSAHSIKGLSAMLGLTDINQLTHKIENVFDAARKGTLSVDGRIVELMFQSLDRLGALIGLLRDPQLPPVVCDELVESIRCVLEAAGAEKKQGSQAEMDRLLKAAVSETAAAPMPAPPAVLPAACCPAADSPVPTASGAQISAVSPQSARTAGEARSLLPLDLIQQVTVASAGRAVLAGLVNFEDNSVAQGLKAELLVEKLSRLGEICYFFPPPESLEQAESVPCVHFGLLSEVSLETLRGELNVGGVQRIVLVDVPAAEPSRSELPAAARQAKRPPDVAIHPEGPAEPQPTPAAAVVPPKPAATSNGGAASANSNADGSKSKSCETLRVDIERLDHLMNLAGQLVIARARFAQIGDTLRHFACNKQAARVVAKSMETLANISHSAQREPEARGEEINRMKGQARLVEVELGRVQQELIGLAGLGGTINDMLEAVHQLELVSDGIQQSVMNIRMLPIGPLFNRFRRVIRDITHVNGKDIVLEIKGEKTELDKRMIDELSDPLVHLVRNAADHGIEPPDVRQAAGKPRQGTIVLNAFHRGNSIVIQISDDGRGLDEQRIRRKCVEKGLLSEADAEKLTRQQVYQMIWEPGLSTAEKVTEISGRGVGMDIVRSKIDSLNGSVDVDSEPGKGTVLSIRLPLTLAILPSLMVEIGSDVFAMPMESVLEIVNISRSELVTVHGKRAADVRNRVVSVVGLEDVFQWNNSASGSAREDSSPITLVIVGDRGREMGLIVDRVIGEEDVVIKSMSENFRSVTGIAGATIFGDGRVSLILDVPSVMEMAARATPTAIAS
jgi:two-component system, chemotaxis family, sensor kinase CheA